jgi:hypothetical protein
VITTWIAPKLSPPERTRPTEEDCRVTLHERREAAMSYVGVVRAGDIGLRGWLDERPCRRGKNGGAGEVRTVVSRRANRA